MAECTICYEPMQRNLSACPCGHVFHFHCILRWLGDPKHRQCPQCRVACHERDLISLFFECNASPASPASPGAAAVADAASSASNSQMRAMLDRATVQTRKLLREKTSMEEELKTLRASSKGRQAELENLRGLAESYEENAQKSETRIRKMKDELFKQAVKAARRQRKIEGMKEELFELKRSGLVKDYASSGRLDVLEKSIQTYEDSTASNGADLEQRVRTLRKMLRVQNDALALRSDEFRRVSSEKRELSERLESKRKELDVAWAEVKEMKARKRHSNSRGSGAVLDENMDKGGLGEDFEQELADIGSFSSLASRGRKKSEKGRSSSSRASSMASAGVASSSSSSSSSSAPSAPFRVDANPRKRKPASGSDQPMRKDIPKWGRGFGSGSGKAWRNPTPFNDSNGKFIKGGYDGMGGMHSVLTLPPKRRGSKRSFAAAALAQSHKRHQSQKKASLDSWFKKR
eukprot:g3938.t1